MPQVGSKSSRFRMVAIAALFWVVGIVSAFVWQVSVRGGICSG